MLEGIAGSKGIAIGKVFIYEKVTMTVSNNIIAEEQTSLELEKLKKAIAISKQQISSIKEKTLIEFGEDKAQIFEAHLMILEDPVVIKEIKGLIINSKINAAFAVNTVINNYYGQFAELDDDYLKERAADIKDVGSRLLRNITGCEYKTLADLKEEVIIVAHDLTPSDTAQLDKRYVLGFATEIGGKTSHTAILANTLEICAVLGLENITKKLKNGDYLILDGFEGKVIINPNDEQIKKYSQKKKEYEVLKKGLLKLVNLPAVTTDGKCIKIAGNIGNPNDIKAVIENGGEGVGLFRTEFLYINRDELPSEEEQLQAYKKVAEAAGGKPVIIRTLDIGGDKQVDCLIIQEEQNPFLGYRAIRLCLDQRDIFKAQLRAILRASIYGQILIMFPMIADIMEIRVAKDVLKEVKVELSQRGVKYDRNIKVGIMIEIPSAAITADIIAHEVDFFSIGTNDLCQYTLAVDRTNEKLSYLYQPFHPSMIRLIKHVIDSSHKEGKFTGMCGEMAGDPLAALLLVGMGIDELSMNSSSIPHVKNIVRSISYEQAVEIASKALKLSTSDEIINFLKESADKLNINNMF
ncbi:MAG: phosphoenolpyruvate--protein phosphotransferase [Clostridia bacterium]|nr:phosphoenolpyruvate--protein phosphotransferase [Clostridia bacterium]